MLEKAITEGFNYGFKSVVGGSTNPISRKISLKVGGHLIKEV